MAEVLSQALRSSILVKRGLCFFLIRALSIKWSSDSVYLLRKYVCSYISQKLKSLFCEKMEHNGRKLFLYGDGGGGRGGAERFRTTP